jgi:hypothetical protein
MSTIHKWIGLIKVFTQGFQVIFGWRHSFQDSVQWALQLASYAAILFFVILLGLSRCVLGNKAFRRPKLDAAAIKDGCTPESEQEEERKGVIEAILDFI